ncbi:MAG: hypothetical protein OXC71_06205 [Chloroflexi bacterium]|nr:hypothetical protein [Chloroflexota bacterium]
MTQERIWRLDEDGDPTPLTAADYDDEADLQKLIADHPEVLAGERMTPDEPRRWLLVSREMVIPDSPESGGRWAVDHLLLDQDARPTLVEVKRGDNSEIRRRVVGQMLDYAAHATRYWTADTIRARLEADPGGEDAARDRIAALGDSDESPADGYEEFWRRVEQNLANENIRLLFVADDIPDDLATVVGFLNRHMAPRVEVLAVELKQFRDEGLRTLVPRVVAGLGRARTRAGASTLHTMESLLAEFPEGATRDAVRELLDRARAAGGVLAFGSSGVSIRARCPAWQHPLVTVAWLFPPGVNGWMWMRDFSFGAAIFSGYDPAPSPALSKVLRSYAGLFEAEPWAHDASGTGTVSWRGAPDDAAEHIETIAGRVEAVLRELAVLPPAE